MVIANVSAFLFKKNPLLNSVKLAPLLILWSLLSILIEVHPLAWGEGGGGQGRLVSVTRTQTLILIISSLVCHSLFSHTDR